MKKIFVLVLALLALTALGLPNLPSDTAQAGPPPIPTYVFAESSVTATIDVPLLPDIIETAVGTTTIVVFTDEFGEASDTDFNGLDQVATEIVAMQLSGPASTLTIRDVSKSPFLMSTGEIEETVQSVPDQLDLPPYGPGSANAYFDIFVELTLLDLGGLMVHNEAPIRMEAVITESPAGAGEVYSFSGPSVPVFNEAGDPIPGVSIKGATMTLVPAPPLPLCRGMTATIVGTAGADVIDGTAGDDVIVGLGGNDLIRGHDGNDTICAGDGDDQVAGGAGNDWLIGEAGADILVGQDGRDVHIGGPGNDILAGGNGGDFFHCGPGEDSAYGGSGDDVHVGGCEVIVSIP